MKKFGEATLHTNGDTRTRVYLAASPSGDYINIGTRKNVPGGLNTVGCVEVIHGNASVGTANNFTGAIIETARQFMLDAGIIRKYETVGGSTEYEMV